jgi:hypothetical protein
MADAMGPLPSWEVECSERTEMWRKELRELAKKPDSQALEAVKTAVNIQLALADLKIKARQADWAKTMAWVPLVLPLVGVIVGAIIGAWLKH